MSPNEVVESTEHLGSKREVLHGLGRDSMRGLQGVRVSLPEPTEPTGRVVRLRMIVPERGRFGRFSRGAVAVERFPVRFAKEEVGAHGLQRPTTRMMDAMHVGIKLR